jgi:hypothetical protein
MHQKTITTPVGLWACGESREILPNLIIILLSFSHEQAFEESVIQLYHLKVQPCITGISLGGDSFISN